MASVSVNAGFTDTSGIELVGAYSELFDQISKGALRSEVVNTVFNIGLKRWEALIAAEMSNPNSKIKHMFEWNPSPGNPADKLFQIVHTNGIVTYNILESKKQVPIDPRLTSPIYTNHVFRKKAEMFESGEQVYIKPVNGKYLRWYSDGSGKGTAIADVSFTKPSKDGQGVEVFAKERLVAPIGSGQYQNQFSNFFSIFWATLGASTEGEVSRVIQSSAAFRGAVAASPTRKSNISSLQSMRGGYKSTLSSSKTSAEAKATAKLMLDEIKSELRKFGVTYNGR